MTCGTGFLVFAILIAVIGVSGMPAVIWLATGLNR